MKQALTWQVLGVITVQFTLQTLGTGGRKQRGECSRKRASGWWSASVVIAVVARNANQMTRVLTGKRPFPSSLPFPTAVSVGAESTARGVSLVRDTSERSC